MSVADGLLEGFRVALTPLHLLLAFAGVTVGTAVGVLPGLGPAVTVALLLPVTYGLDPTGAFIMFAGIYYGAMYGGSTTSILLNTPGESATIVTAIDGYQMARRGRAGAALATAAIGSFVAGTLGTIGITLAATPLVALALRFGPADYFALIAVAFVATTSVLGASRLRGLTSLFLGVVLGLVGIDALSGATRFTVGLPQLADGIDPVLVAVGLFAVGETLASILFPDAVGADLVPMRERATLTRDDWRRSWRPWLRGTAIGFPLGALPAGGAELPTLLSYAVEKRLAANPDEFGHGAIEGVAGPEAANNASAAGTLVPLLALGLPTTATAAVMLAAFQQFGLQPGPLLLEREPRLVWGIIASLYVGNTMLLALNLPLAGVWARLLSIPARWLSAGILVVATVGAYSIHRSTFDLLLMYTVGAIGVALRRFDYPLAPVVMGLILGPLAEQQFRRALIVSDGDLSVFFTRPISATLLAIAAAIVIWPVVRRCLSSASDRG